MAWTNYTKSKYGSKKVEFDGIQFDSKKEAQRYKELRLLQKEGKIANLQRQVKFELIPSQRINGKVVERSCSYIADFTYLDLTVTPLRYVVEDTKGFKTADYIIKRKLMLYVHKIKVQEI